MLTLTSHLRPDFEVEEAVRADLVEHVVEEADGRLGDALAGAVQVDGDRDAGLLGLPHHGGDAGRRRRRGLGGCEDGRDDGGSPTGAERGCTSRVRAH